MPAAASVVFNRQRSVERVVAHLQASIRAGEPLPDLAALAAVAQQSPHHFHRVYRALAGETLGQTIARLRLSYALHLLGEPASTVTEVALAVGYQTPQALARAFRSLLQASPSSLRNAPAVRAQKLQQLAMPSLPPQMSGAPCRCWCKYSIRWKWWCCASAAPSTIWTVASAASRPGPSAPVRSNTCRP